MGLLNSLTAGAGTVDQLNPSSFIGASGFDTTPSVTDILGGSAHSALGAALGLDDDCPKGAGGGGDRAGAANDPCGKGNNSLAEAVLGLGMASAGPSIAETGAAIGAGLDSGLGEAISFLGDGISAAAGGVGDFFGTSEETKGLMGNALGVGVGVGIGGADGATSGAAALTSVAQTTNDQNTSKASNGTESNFFDKVGETIGF